MKLIQDWRRTWRFFSVWAMTVTGALQGAWLAIPGDLKHNIPDGWVNAVSIVLLVLGVIGRMVKQSEASNENK